MESHATTSAKIDQMQQPQQNQSKTVLCTLFGK